MYNGVCVWECASWRLLHLHRLELKSQLSLGESVQFKRKQTEEVHRGETQRRKWRWLTTRWVRTCRLEPESSPSGSRSPWTELRRRWVTLCWDQHLHPNLLYRATPGLPSGGKRLNNIYNLFWTHLKSLDVVVVHNTTHSSHKGTWHGIFLK